MSDEVIDVAKLRASLLGEFKRIAERSLKKGSNRSMVLSCSQFYCDEAGDAVHARVSFSEQELPLTSGIDSEDGDSDPFDWDSNTDGPIAFAAMCVEEGSDPDEEAADPKEEVDWENYEEGASSSALLAYARRRGDGTVEVHWVGNHHRPWMDFPDVPMQREDFGGDAVSEESVLEDPPFPAIGKAEQKLYQAMLAAPHELERRRVLFDAWSERGDARGEFGMLWVAKRTRAAVTRAAELVAQHGRSWLHPLGSVIPLSGALFGGGPFVKKAIVYAEDKKTFDAVADHERWGTVESLVFATESHRRLTPAMTALREAGPLDAKALSASKGFDFSQLEQLDYEGALTGLKRQTLPNLKRLLVRHDAPLKLDELSGQPWFAQLERIEQWLPGAKLSDPKLLQKCFEALERGAPKLAEVRLGLLNAGMRSGWMVCRPAGGGRVVRLFKPDHRLERHAELTGPLKAELDERWEPEDDWLSFGLGVTT